MEGEQRTRERAMTTILLIDRMDLHLSVNEHRQDSPHEMIWQVRRTQQRLPPGFFRTVTHCFCRVEDQMIDRSP